MSGKTAAHLINRFVALWSDFGGTKVPSSSRQNISIITAGSAPLYTIFGAKWDRSMWREAVTHIVRIVLRTVGPTCPQTSLRACGVMSRAGCGRPAAVSIFRCAATWKRRRSSFGKILRSSPMYVLAVDGRSVSMNAAAVCAAVCPTNRWCRQTVALSSSARPFGRAIVAASCGKRSRTDCVSLFGKGRRACRACSALFPCGDAAPNAVERIEKAGDGPTRKTRRGLPSAVRGGVCAVPAGFSVAALSSCLVVFVVVSVVPPPRISQKEGAGGRNLIVFASVGFVIAAVVISERVCLVRGPSVG